jgi:hypothetical protein
MSDNVRSYNYGLKHLKQAQEALAEAERHFAASSYGTDDFPTTRHEIMELSEESQKLLKKVEALYTKAHANRFR